MFRFQGNGILITVPGDVFDITRDVMRRARPAEGCALLFGHVDAGEFNDDGPVVGSVAARDVGGPKHPGRVIASNEQRSRSLLVFRVLDVMPVENVLGSPSAFEIDPVVQYQEIKKAESRGQALVGILHTHPGAQFVSSTDERYMRNAARFSRFCWLIAGESGGALEIGAYVVVGDDIVHVGTISG